MPPTRLRITDRTGDLFAAPANTLLIHACNTVGSWGGGIALAFRNLYPAEFRVYRAHCARSTPNQLVGTALLIRPQQQQQSSGGGGRGHYIGCLFTSRRFGAARDPPERILRATVPAMRHLMRLVAEEEARTGGRIGEVRMCRINAGLFAVPWESSKRALEAMELRDGEVPGCAEEGVVEVVAWERP
jgi:ADP-ribose 1''-phosphate phosphatase